MYKLPKEYLSVDPAGIILKNCCESLITIQGSFTLFVCIKIDPSGKEVFVPCSLKCISGLIPLSRYSVLHVNVVICLFRRGNDMGHVGCDTEYR